MLDFKLKIMWNFEPLFRENNNLLLETRQENLGSVPSK